MASLDDPYFVKGVKSILMPGARQKVTIYDVELQSSSDTLTVPALAHTNSGKSLTNGITATPAAANEGVSVITITGGSQGTRALIACAHIKGRANWLTQDEDPT